jgi:hypothetical protein
MAGSKIRLGFKGKKIVGKNIPQTHPGRPVSNFPALNHSAFRLHFFGDSILSCAEPRPSGNGNLAGIFRRVGYCKAGGRQLYQGPGIPWLRVLSFGCHPFGCPHSDSDWGGPQIAQNFTDHGAAARAIWLKEIGHSSPHFGLIWLDLVGFTLIYPDRWFPRLPFSR